MKLTRLGLFGLLTVAVWIPLIAGTANKSQKTAPRTVPRAPDKIWAENILESLSLREKIAQLIQIRVAGKFLNRRNPDFLAIRDLITQNHVGGVCLFAGNIYESAILLNTLQASSKTPLLVSADFERGVSFRIADATSFPWTMAIGATGSEQFAFRQGEITARESRAIGVHWIFAPVLDVNNNPENPVINIRSFGEDPELVARLGTAFIRGAKKGGVLATAKHFPGHGDTATDSHLGLAVLNSDLARLQALEFAPFKRAIEAGVDAIMTAHVAIPQVTGAADLPATLSQEILTGLLRNSMNFKGLVVTDALEMGGITNHYWRGLAAVRAIQAGADVLLLPPDAVIAINEIERAVKLGDITETRIDDSVRKILLVKSSLGLHKARTVSIDRIGETVAEPQSVQLAQDIADHSITAVRDDQQLLPVNPISDRRVFSLVLASDLETSPGAVFQAEMRRRFPSLNAAWVNARISPESLSGIEKAISSSDLIVCSTITRLTSGQDTIGIPESQRTILQKLMAARKPLIWVAFGNPYVLRLAPQAGTYLCTFSYSDVSQTAAAKALAGEIAITGKMPVSIPERAVYGDGLQIPKLEMTLKPASSGTTASSREAFEKAGKLLSSLIESDAVAGAALVVGLNNSIIYESSAGTKDDSINANPFSTRTRTDPGSIANLLDPLAVTMLAIDSANLLPGAAVKDYLPETRSSSTGGRQIQQLWTTPVQNTEAADSPFILLQDIVSRACGMPHDRYLASRLFKPLGMEATYSGLSRTGKKTILLSTEDLAIFSQMLLNRGVYNHRRFFGADTIRRFTGMEQSWGWAKPSASDWTGRLFSPSAYGHNATSGAMLWIDPSKNLFIVLLTTGAATNNADKVLSVQESICGSVLQALGTFQ
jgi:beta-N-acetylhexosaminidase